MIDQGQLAMLISGIGLMLSLVALVATWHLRSRRRVRYGREPR